MQVGILPGAAPDRHHVPIPICFIAFALLFAGSTLANDLIADATTQILLRPAEFQQVEISPDGKMLAIERYSDTGPVVSLHRRDTMAVIAGINPGKGGRIGTLEWLDNDRLIVSSDRPSGLYGVSFRESVLYIVGADGKDTFQLPGNFVAAIEGDPDHLLVSKCGSGGESGEGCIPEIRRADTNRVRRVGELVIAGPQGSILLTDRKGNVRFANKWEDDGGSKAYVHGTGSRPHSKTCFRSDQCDSGFNGVDSAPDIGDHLGWQPIHLAPMTSACTHLHC